MSWIISHPLVDNSNIDAAARSLAVDDSGFKLKKRKDLIMAEEWTILKKRISCSKI